MTKASEFMREAVAPKKRGRKAKPKPEIEFKDGLHEIESIETVPVADIDLEDRRFQYRVAEKISDLLPSLTTEGQLVPVVLHGKEPPFVIIDGFRRVSAIKSLGWVSVRAIVHRKTSEEDAYRISFAENFKRKSFSPIDIAHAVFKAISRGKTQKELEVDFHLSERQIQRYKALIEFSDEIKAVLADGTITMAQARVLNQIKPKEIGSWIDRAKEGLSANALKRALKEEFGPKTKPRKYFKKENDGFRLYPIRFTSGAPKKQRDHIKKVLQDALALIDEVEKKEKNP